MKTLRFVVAAAVALGSVSAFATNARVESMGKSTRFIMDDISIFDNPANMNLYPNFLIGELGHYMGPAADAVGAGENHDPFDPWFGGIFALGIGAEKSISIGGVLNRRDERLLRFFPDRIRIGDGPNDVLNAPDPATNFDGFLGASLGRVALGAHIYVAHQDGVDKEGRLNNAAFVSALQTDLGTNIEISNSMSFELSGGAARLQYGSSRSDGLFDTDLMSFFGRTRLFSRVNAINGNLIPAASVYNMNAPGRDEFEVNLGMGVDAAFDRGFFWLGLNGFYNKQRAGSTWQYIDGFTVYTDEGNYKDIGKDAWGDSRTTLDKIGGTISFGIERNIWWDWFVIRVGGQKTIAYADYAGNKANSLSILCPARGKDNAGCDGPGNFFITNPVNDGTIDDNVGFGFGVNIEEKLKIDATVTEDLLFRNPFQGGSRILSRISATYSF
ncbi:MAG: hypothetical protein LBC85_05040 [Fibromonadaceae bacterium]|jgi:hypothetical protein|nr:hypothetical protein [Fibromonadaceae bacterium]